MGAVADQRIQKRSVTSSDSLAAAWYRNHVRLDAGGGDGNLTLPAASTLPDGWWCILENFDAADFPGWWYLVGTVDGVAVDGTGYAFPILPGEKRFLTVSGGAWISTVERPFFIHYRDLSLAFRWPSGYRFASGTLWGAGGSGARWVSATGCAGGGGGGAAHPFNAVKAPAAGSTVTFTCASSATGPTAQGNGVVGGTSALAIGSATLSAYGGGGGYASSTSGSAGSGGGQLGPGVTGVSASLTANGGSPQLPSGTSTGGQVGGANGFAGNTTVSTTNPSHGGLGGAGGGWANTLGAKVGGNAVIGGPGGGAGGDAGSSAGGACAATGAVGGAGASGASGGNGTGPGAGGGGCVSSNAAHKAGDGGPGAITLTGIS